MSVYACSDIHGNIALLNKILEFLKTDDTVYFLGDAADRGKDGWEIIKNIYNDSRFIYLKGNHEDMLVKAMREFIEEEGQSHSALNLLKYNGGKHTYNAWREDGTSRSWIHRLEFLPTVADYVNKNKTHFIMTHAGFTPYNDRTPEVEDLLWDRGHIDDRCDWWPIDNLNDYVLHGHTYCASKSCFGMIDTKLNNSNTVGRYCYGHKICIDGRSFLTNKIAMLDLDTLEETVFDLSK